MSKGEFPKGETFALRLKRLRDEQGLTIIRLATECHATESAIRALETGAVKHPSFPLGLMLSKSLHVDPYYLALGESGSVTSRILENAERISWSLQDLAARVTALEATDKAARAVRRR